MNKTAIITFSKVLQDSQDLGSDNEHMVSRVFFDLAIDGKSYTSLHSDIKQVVGSSYESGPLEVSAPHGYDGPFNYNAFRDEVEKYYRSQVGSGGSGIRIEGGASNIRMRNNTFHNTRVARFLIEG